MNKQFLLCALLAQGPWFAGGLVSVAAASQPSYLSDVRPILSEHCFACHGPDASQRQAELRLDLRDIAIGGLPSGNRAITPGNVDASELLSRIESNDPELVMPPPEFKQPLEVAQKSVLRQWIESGAPYEQHWAYVAPVRPVPPEVQQVSWIRNDIDRFVLAGLEDRGLTPSPEADRTTLIRRLSLDITGLPPTVAEVEAFIADTRPEAYELLVDRLLASPHYGEKMAQGWLDLARFGDTSGYQDDNDRPNFPYRDYVIGAFNANLPFDRFTLENIAGDLLPDATISQRVASGFNRLHRHNEEGGSDPEEFRVLYAVDRANTVAATWMGLTLGCAQCHDHKYDPITQREYYGFFAFFNSLKGELPIIKGPVCPPQIRVPGPLDQIPADQFARGVQVALQQLTDLESHDSLRFEEWLATGPEPEADPASSKPDGAVGGVVARLATPAYYGDVSLGPNLNLNQRLTSSGRVAVERGVNTDATVGHFATKPDQGEFFPAIGWEIAEGPRFFAAVTLADGRVVQASPIAGEYQVEYAWTCEYVPADKRLTLVITRSGAVVGRSELNLADLGQLPGVQLNAFGISARTLSAADAPLEFYLDDVTYTAGPDEPLRHQSFDGDPNWQGFQNESGGHRFGFVRASSLGEAERQRIRQLLLLSSRERTPDQNAQLRAHYFRHHSPGWAALTQAMDEAKKAQAEFASTLPLALVWEEMETPRPAHLLKRGDYQQPLEVVERGVPAALPALPEGGRRDRLALAHWLVSRDHPLTSRVIANRIWTQFFGHGLVRTPEDFGVRGELPTHPELLDYLAVSLQTGNSGDPSATDSPGDSASEESTPWNLKAFIKQIVTSATYRQSSALTPSLREADPDNRLLARNARFRLTAEEIRDTALAAAGLLNRQVGGRSVFPHQPENFYRDKEDDPGEWKWTTEQDAQAYRRGLYTFVRRTSPYPAFQTFDAPSRGECTVARSTTNTPLQALIALNDPVFVEASQALGEQAARNCTDPEARIGFLFRAVLTRHPAGAEVAVLRQLYDTEFAHFAADPVAAGSVQARKSSEVTTTTSAADAAACTLLANVLLNLDEAMTRE